LKKPALIRIHSSFHKCLTRYFIRIFNSLYNTTRPYRPSYRHFESIEGVFYNNLTNYKVLSVNGFAVDLSRLGENFRISRFVRDPRDLIISGYFYHKSGSEPWFKFKSPTLKYWYPINGNIPLKMPKDISYSEYLQDLSMEDGLIAEIEFRKYHLDSLRQWKNDERIKIFKYENILGNEKRSFEELLRFYDLPFYERKLGVWLAGRYSVGNKTVSKNVRNPVPGQYKDYFTPKVTDHFNDHYGDILDLLGYSY